MTKLKPITDPAELLRLFTKGYRRLSPQVPITDATARSIDAVVDDLIAGRNIDVIQNNPDDRFVISS